MSNVEEQDNQEQENIEETSSNNFYKYGPIVISIITSLLLIFGLNNDGKLLSEVSTFGKILSPIYGLPGAYIGLGIGIVVKSVLSNFVVYGSLGYVIKMKILVSCSSLIGMFIGSCFSMLIFMSFLHQ